MALLEVTGLNVYYGVIHAIKDVSFVVNEGEIVSLIGANGAGKTTILHTVSGLIKAKGGTICFGGEDITKTPAHKIVAGGMAQVPEGRRIFAQLSVYDNLRLGAFTRSDGAEIKKNLQMVYQCFPRLEERKNQIAGTLSGGEQQMLAIGRAMMSNPKLLMLDEPSLGLSPVLTEKIFELVLEIQKQGYTIILVEQNAVMALSIADRAYALQNGRITATGTGESLLASAEIVNSYLG